MAQPVRIGFLSPYSSIYPGMVPGTISGFYSGIPERYHGLFHIVPEYIGQGGEKTVLEAVHKLIGFHRVDMLAGVISYRALPGLVPAIEKHGRPALFFDAGEYLPYPHPLSDVIFCNSFQLWQSQFALGEWAHREFGEKGAVVMPIYDAGYHLQSAFRQGAVTAGAEALDLHVLPYRPGGSQVTEAIGEVFSALEQARVSFVHAVFCGTEAREFLHAFTQSGLKGKVPLVVTAHMASDEILGEMGNLDMALYSASLWRPGAQDDANMAFIRNVRDFAQQKPDFYTLLGYEAGLLFSQLVPEFERRDWKAIKEKMKQEAVEGPRGTRSFCMGSTAPCPAVDIEKIALGSNGAQPLVIGQGTPLPYNHAVYETIHRENISGWQNPYLCV
ncbi:ABC transporter substrate-binding protein [Desulfoluna spongiiphila]|uniref:Amino acid/amide ABC transporter substrate-binding protein, HAAT family n=1 Tax=Desulfoluna spongiiphila TaxID=419481 RepID=A0A1G5E9T1_9BACT|nr:ABC transporter substrate-binding protein [Desulfoluna spongiiphila]SCY23511.1 amino acid/amide ABC transporter substrate-binding protein, HAAT family [Desulfoluna spongiiphila]